MSPAWATWANLLTAFRLATIPGIIWAIVGLHWLVASALFTFAVITDIYDGRLARRFNQQSTFGGVFDHATDAFFVTAGSAALAHNGFINVYLAPLILITFTQYLLDSKVLVGQPLRTSAIGRCNGIAYFALVGTTIGANTLNCSTTLNFTWLLQPVAWTAWLLVATSLISMADRLFALWQVRRRSN